MGKSVEIFFGTLFRVLEWGKPTERIDLITDVCESSYFESCRIKFNEKGELFVPPVGFGTGGPEIFSEAVGRMDPDAVIEAIERGWAEFGHPIPDELRKKFQQRKNGKRKLKLL